LFFRLWGVARDEVCGRYNLSALIRTDEREARHRWLRECTDGRTDNINAVRPGAEFGRVMLATAIEAGDFEEAARWELDTAKRWRWFMENLVRQIGEITGEPRPWAYVQGIFAHLGRLSEWQDIPEGDLQAVWQILDTHRRRILKRDHFWMGLRKSDADPLAFFPEAEYFFRADGRLGIRFPPPTAAAPASSRRAAAPAREAVTA
jgi:hypothetical protein